MMGPGYPAVEREADPLAEEALGQGKSVVVQCARASGREPGRVLRVSM